jgi:hypothetical protein
MHGRRWQRGVGCSLAVAAMIAAGTSSPAESVSRAHGAALAGTGVKKFPQSYTANEGGELAKVGHNVFFAMITAKANTKLGRINPKGKTRIASAQGPAYAFNAPTKTTDGGVYVVVDQSEGPGNKGIALAGLNPSAWTVKTSTTKNVEPLAFWPTVADQSGRFWAQGNVVDKGIAVVGAGVDKPLKVVKTNLGPVQSGLDAAVANPIILGPDGHVWLLGGDGVTGNLAIASIGPNGIRQYVTPRRLATADLALTRGANRVWTVAGAHGQKLVAVGVDATGAVTRVPTGLQNECLTDSVKPVADSGTLWFTGCDVSCAQSELFVAKVAMGAGTATTIDAGVGVLGDAASSVLPVSDGVIVAGVTDAGTLAISRVTDDSRVIDTGLLPYLSNEQGRYPMVSDRNDGVWAQGVNGKGNLVVVRSDGASVTRTKTGLKPTAREITVGPDQSLWTQGLHQGKLVIVKVGLDGTATKYQTGLAPTKFGFVMAPVSDGKGHLWFQGAKSNNGDLVMVRVPANG